MNSANVDLGKIPGALDVFLCISSHRAYSDTNKSDAAQNELKPSKFLSFNSTKTFFFFFLNTSYFVTISVQRSENNMVARTKMDLHDSFYKNSSLSFSLKERGKKEKITFWMII